MDDTTHPDKINDGNVERQIFLATYNKQEKVKTWTWRAEGRQFIFHLLLPFPHTFPYGTVYKVEMVYASDSWDIILCAQMKLHAKVEAFC